MTTLTQLRNPLRVRAERERRSILIRFWWNWIEFAYIVLGLRGLRAEIEFPSDWHEHRMGWVRIGLGVVSISFAFPWKWVVPDHYQCSGPTYGFSFFCDGLHLHWGKSKGVRGDPFTIISMPWRWKLRLSEVIGGTESHFFKYTLKSGEVQERVATISPRLSVWTRFWFPWKREDRYINVEFSDEVGERSGTWKGGVIGCSFPLRADETPCDALKRAEREAKL